MSPLQRLLIDLYSLLIPSLQFNNYFFKILLDDVLPSIKHSVLFHIFYKEPYFD